MLCANGKDFVLWLTTICRKFGCDFALFGAISKSAIKMRHYERANVYDWEWSHSGASANAQDTAVPRTSQRSHLTIERSHSIRNWKDFWLYSKCAPTMITQPSIYLRMRAANLDLQIFFQFSLFFSIGHLTNTLFPCLDNQSIERLHGDTTNTMWWCSHHWQ